MNKSAIIGWSKPNSASVNKLPKAYEACWASSMTQGRRQGCFLGTCLLEAVFGDDAAKLAELCGCGISPHSESMQVPWLSLWLSGVNTRAFLWFHLSPAERPTVVCKRWMHMLSALFAVLPPQLHGLLCVLLASLSQTCCHKTYLLPGAYQALEEARTAVGPRGAQWRL